MVTFSANEIRQSVLFRNVSLETILPQLQACKAQELDRGSILLDPANDNNCIFLVLSGSLGVHFEALNTPEIRMVLPGECVGELSLIEQTRPSAYVVAREHSRVLGVHREAFWDLVDQEGRIARNLLGLFSKWILHNTRNIVESRRHIRTLETESQLDGLTGVYNRRWLDNTLPKYVGRSVKPAGPLLVLILIDVDYFKQYNDTWGHKAGDQALIALGRVLTDHVRPGGFVARYGGEEFAVLLPDANLEEAAVAAERFRIATAQKDIRMPDGTSLPAIAISQGLAQAIPGMSAADLVVSADEQLYRAKRAGRNRVCHR